MGLELNPPSAAVRPSILTVGYNVTREGNFHTLYLYVGWRHIQSAPSERAAKAHEEHHESYDVLHFTSGGFLTNWSIFSASRPRDVIDG